MKKLARIIVTLSLLFLPVTTIVAPSLAYADSKGDACAGVGGAIDAATGKCVVVGQSGSVEGTIKTVVQVLGFLVGAISLIMIIVGGIKYVVSGGDANAIGSAKNTILYAVVGLVVALLAEAIARFAFSKATK